MPHGICALSCTALQHMKMPITFTSSWTCAQVGTMLSSCGSTYQQQCPTEAAGVVSGFCSLPA